MKKIYFSIILLSFIVGLTGHLKQKKYPKPEGVKHLLFYVQRTQNTNTIIYELNVNDKDEINIKNPIKIYWINYADDESTEPLNYVQKKYAYGIETEMLDTDKKTFRFSFVAYKSKELYLMKNPADNKYHVFYYIKDKLLMLDRVFIKTEGGLFWPKVKYTDVFCMDHLKNEEVTERIIP